MLVFGLSCAGALLQSVCLLLLIINRQYMTSGGSLLWIYLLLADTLMRAEKGRFFFSFDFSLIFLNLFLLLTLGERHVKLFCTDQRITVAGTKGVDMGRTVPKGFGKKEMEFSLVASKKVLL